MTRTLKALLVLSLIFAACGQLAEAQYFAAIKDSSKVIKTQLDFLVPLLDKEQHDYGVISQKDWKDKVDTATLNVLAQVSVIKKLKPPPNRADVDEYLSRYAEMMETAMRTLRDGAHDSHVDKIEESVSLIAIANKQFERVAKFLE